MATAHRIAPTLTEQQISRFWAKVARGGPDDCWPWTGCIMRHGYGKFTLRFAAEPGRPVSFGAHALARFLATGEWPDGLCTLHRCDNRRCCNPAHLWLGSNAENSADMVAKGRSHHANHVGEASPRAKLTEAQVRTIRRRHAAGGVTYVQLGQEFRVHPVSIRLIIKRINWGHLADD